MNQMRSKIRAELEKKFKRRMVKTVADRVSNEVPDELALQVAKDFPVFFQRCHFFFAAERLAQCGVHPRGIEA